MFGFFRSWNYFHFLESDQIWSGCFSRGARKWLEWFSILHVLITDDDEFSSPSLDLMNASEIGECVWGNAHKIWNARMANHHCFYAACVLMSDVSIELWVLTKKKKFRFRSLSSWFEAKPEKWLISSASLVQCVSRRVLYVSSNIFNRSEI